MNDMTVRRGSGRVLVLLWVGILVWGALAAGADTWPNCSFRCTANDVQMTSVFADVVQGGCEPGEIVNAPVRGVFTANATRYAVIVLGDLYVNGVLNQRIQQCVVETIVPPGGTYTIADISWPCGATVAIRNLVVSWAASAATCADTPECSARGAKCSAAASLPVSTPLVVSFTTSSPQCLGTAISFTSQVTGGKPPYSYAWDFGDGGTSAAANPTHAYAETGTYTVTLTVTDSGGNVDSHSLSATALPLPPAAADNGGPYCAGETIQLSASGGTSYSWTGPGGFTSTQQNPTVPSASAAKAGTYAVTVSASGCSAQATTSVTVSSLPTATAANGGPYCVGQTIQLSAPGGASYSWTGPGGFASAEQNPAIPGASSVNAGTYAVTVTNASGCSAVASTAVEVDATSPVLTLPTNRSVACGSSTDPTATGQASATDAQDPHPVITHSDVQNLSGCQGTTGTIARTWTATDACGNASTGVQTITIVDTTPPALTVPPSVTVPCGGSTDPAAAGQASATDACSTPVVTYVDQANLTGCGGTGTITRTWKATDACGNVATGVQTITVADTTPPSLTLPANLAVDCGHSTDPSATGQALATDACGAVAISHSDTSSLSDCNRTGTITRTWRAVDACGNAATGVQTITVADTTPPSLTLPVDITVECGHSTDPSATGQPVATDACGTVTISHSDIASLSGCNGTGTITRTWRAVDACGNVATGLQTIAVVDAIAPTLTIPADATVQSGQPTDPSATGQASAIDDCTPSPLVTYADQATLSGPGGSGTITRTWTATDACGNVATAVQTITVVAAPPPPLLVLRVPADITVGTEDPTDPSKTGQATTSDTCPTPPTLTYSDQSDLIGCDGTGTILRTWRATDACGSVVSGVQTITVADTIFPVLTVPADVTVDCGEPTDPSATGTAAATDPHGEEEYALGVTYVDQTDLTGCGSTGTISRTWKATEDCGNSATGTQTITVVDRTPPTLTVPADVTVDPGEPTGPTATGTAVASDSCSAVTVTYADQADLGGCDGTGKILRTWRAADACGNAAIAVQTITVADTSLPVLTVPADLTVDCGQPTDPSATGTATASDPHADEEFPANVTYSDEVNLTGCGGTGTILRTWEATEACGHSVSVTQTITVVDRTRPVLFVPPDVTIECHHLPPLSAHSTGRASATDACSGPVSTSYEDVYSLSGCDATGTILRTWRAVDPCGNVATGTQTITILHTTPPVLAVPPDVTIQCHDATTPSTTGQATASSDCGSAPTLTYTDVPSLAGCDGTGTISRTWRAVDGCGNVSTGVQTITVADTTAPVLAVPAEAVVQCGQPVDPSATGKATAVDDCDPAPATSYSDVPSLTGCAGRITRTWQAVDGCGNATTGVQTITVQETPRPVTLGLTVPPDVTLPCGHSADPSATGEAAAAGNCGGPITITYGDVSSLGGCEGAGTVARTWRAEDACGNVKTGVQTVTAVPSAPVLVVPPDVTIECGHAVDPSATGTASAVHSCGRPLSVSFKDVPFFDVTGTATIVRTWRTVDACGTEAEGSQRISILRCPIRRVVISEVAWAGTPASPDGEWIELANPEEEPVDLGGWTLRWKRKQIETPSDRTSREVPLRGSIDARQVGQPIRFEASPENPGAWWVSWDEASDSGFYLLERGADSTVSDVVADLVYDTSEPLDPRLALDDAGDILELVDPYGRIVDTANADHPERDGWPAGDLTTTGTMERTDLLRDNLDENWHTNLGLWTWGTDSEGKLLLGTARRQNSPLLADVAQALTAGPIQIARGGTLRLALRAARQGEGVPATLWALLSRPGEAEIASLAATVTTAAAGISVEIDTSTLPLGQSFLWLRYGGGDVLLVPLDVTP